MHLSENFQTVVDIDLSHPVVDSFRSSLLAIDWNNQSNTYMLAKKLSYAPGFSFHDIDFCNRHTVYQQALSEIDKKYMKLSESVETALILSKSFFSYIEELIPNSYVVKSEILFNPPEKMCKQNELERMHIDIRNLHKISRRCQLGIITNDDAFLCVEGEYYKTSIDKIITFNNRKTHWGVNWGNTPKLTLIFDLLDRDIWNKLSEEEKNSFYNISVPNEDDARHNQFCIEFANKHGLIYDTNKPRY